MRLRIDSDRLMTNGARLISNLWAATWISFGIASGISQGLTFVRVVFDLAISGLFFTLLQCLARRRAVLGGLLLFLFGITLTVALPAISRRLHGNTLVFVFLTMALPPLVAGIMYMMDWHSKNLSIANQLKENN
jgi:hypothetical protein